MVSYSTGLQTAPPRSFAFATRAFSRSALATNRVFLDKDILTAKRPVSVGRLDAGGGGSSLALAETKRNPCLLVGTKEEKLQGETASN